MKAVIADALNYADQRTIDAFAAKTIENLDVGIAELQRRGDVRPKVGVSPGAAGDATSAAGDAPSACAPEGARGGAVDRVTPSAGRGDSSRRVRREWFEAT